MAGEWKNVKIGDICEGIYDGPHATPKKTSCGPVFLGISCLDKGRLNLSNADYLSDKDYISWTRRITPIEEDIVFSYETRIGEAAIIPSNLKCCLGRRLALMRPDKKKVVPRFLLYAYLGPEFQDILRSRTVHGSTVDRIPLIEFSNFPIRVPPLNIQRAIAHILGTLDDKIELNRRMNETLEEMARAIFKSWFVNFDPVRAKAEGRDTGLPKHIADLFPDEFEESELGRIPKGWRVATWGVVIELKYGKSLRNYHSTKDTYPVFGTNGQIGWCSESLCKHPGIVIGRKGAYRGIHFSVLPFFVIDTAFYVEIKEKIDLRWAYYMMQRINLNTMDSGSAIPSTSKDSFYALKVVLPSFNLQEIFVKLLEPCWKRKEINEKESDTLATLLDSLLPKLISGEIEIDRNILEGSK